MINQLFDLLSHVPDDFCCLKGFLKSQGAGHRAEKPNFLLGFVKFQASVKIQGLWENFEESEGYLVAWLLECFTEESSHGDTGTKHLLEEEIEHSLYLG